MILLKKTSDRADMMEALPFGPGFSPAQAQKAQVMEIYGTAFNDPHEECVFVLRNERGQVVGEARMTGY